MLGRSRLAQAPTHRPMWLMVLGILMVMVGGRALVDGVQKVRDPRVVLSPLMTTAASTDAELQLTRKLAAACAAAVMPHATALRVAAGFELLIALFTLYAAAAVFSRDRNGRTLALGVAVLGIGYQLGTLPIYLGLMRDYAAQGAPLLAEAIVMQTRGMGAADQRPTVEELARRLPAAIVGWPIVVAAMGVVGSLLLLGYFGGRRGRTLYGLEPSRDTPPAS